MTVPIRRGFTLIEIMVVLAIVSILFAMGFVSLSDQRRAGEVESEAERLAGVLRMVRNRAMNEQKGYGVAFNICNGVGTSGAVLNNWDGGHYYRVFGAIGNEWKAPPRMGSFNGQNEWRSGSNFPDYVEAFREIWVSPPYRLPARSVRILALSDLDRGPRMHPDGVNSKTTMWGDVYYSGDATYPRPWFGIYDEAAGKWWPWGGYTQGKRYSGFYYEGDDGPITGSLHPSDRKYDNDFNRRGGADAVNTRFSWDFDGKFENRDLNGDGDFDDPFENEIDYTIWEQGKPRDLVNADWLDACIMFSPTGEAMFMEWNMYRRPFFVGQAYLDGQKDAAGNNLPSGLLNGINDRCMLQHSRGVLGSVGLFHTSSPNDWKSHKHPESQHFVAHNGGYYITLAPDAAVDSNSFATVEEALDSIDPSYRVFVGVSGTIKVIRVQRRRSGSFLDARPTWPESPTDWQNDAEVARVHQVGYMHEEGTVGYNKTPTLIGEPINLMVTGRMLTERVWWFND